MKADERLYFFDDPELGIKRNEYPQSVFDRHLERYKIAIELCGKEGGLWLDCGSGSGYGSKLLSKRASEVISIEIDQLSVKYAKRHYSSQKIQFIQGDILCLNKYMAEYLQKIDTVMCIEVIEHLQGGRKLLEQIYDILKPGGCAVITTPLSNYRGGPNPKNKFHLMEYTFEQFFDLLNNFFDERNIIFRCEQKISTASESVVFLYARCVK